jgi:hypothetical protein
MWVVGRQADVQASKQAQSNMRGGAVWVPAPRCPHLTTGCTHATAGSVAITPGVGIGITSLGCNRGGGMTAVQVAFRGKSSSRACPRRDTVSLPDALLWPPRHPSTTHRHPSHCTLPCRGRAAPRRPRNQPWRASSRQSAGPTPPSEPPPRSAGRPRCSAERNKHINSAAAHSNGKQVQGISGSILAKMLAKARCCHAAMADVCHDGTHSRSGSGQGRHQGLQTWHSLLWKPAAASDLWRLASGRAKG